MRKKFISILLSVAMVLSMLLAPGTEAMAAGQIKEPGIVSGHGSFLSTRTVIEKIIS